MQVFVSGKQQIVLGQDPRPAVVPESSDLTAQPAFASVS